MRPCAMRCRTRRATPRCSSLRSWHLDPILHADQIVVLKDGEVVGLGTHGELMETCEVYRAIAESQMKGGE